MMKNILVGIQPTGRLHIGHYIGVLKPALELDKKELVHIMIADYHALTTQKEVDGRKMFNQIKNMGLPNVSYQSRKAPLLFWKLIAQEPIGNLKHLPQFKSKEQTLGMLTYPVLMACDIILSNCTHVLVGEDQEPHMEYYRYIAKKNGYKNIAESIVLKDSKIMSIKDPSKKMSKSLGDEHCIYLDDTKENIKRKIMKSPTTLDGIQNLKRIAKAFNCDYDETKNAMSKELLVKAICEELKIK
jgi:tryptophanyl-tRNA synthetase